MTTTNDGQTGESEKTKAEIATPNTESFHNAVIEGPLHAIAARYREFARELEREHARERTAREAAEGKVGEMKRLLDYIGIELAGTEFQRLSDRILQFYDAEQAIAQPSAP